MLEGEYKRDFRPLFWLKEACRGLDYVEHRLYEGWRDYMPFYRIHCMKHGEIVTYPHGYMGLLQCPQCFAESFGKLKSLEDIE